MGRYGASTLPAAHTECLSVCREVMKTASRCEGHISSVSGDRLRRRKADDGH